MSTTRHHLNRQRRRQALAEPSARRAPGNVLTDPATDPMTGTDTGTEAGPAPEEKAETGPARKKKPAPGARRTGGAQDGPRPRRLLPLAVLCVLTLLLGGFAGWAHSRAGALRDDPARANTALTDLARTSEVKGRTAAAVAALFSYDHADPAAFEKAGKTHLTGKAVEQHRTLFGGVLAQAARQKMVITTTVTDSAVERIDGDRARVLVYADQSSVSTAGAKKDAKKDGQAQDQGVYAGAMFAVDVVLRDGRWLVENIDTFGR
ncbi:hypothetical protein ACIQRS_21645 [Streptomyces termitum]|uniref:Membrane protein n=1 Tax=Streptomyces termitum TaxID=67368 RepID=A0A918WAZ5_9ACTN|nr:hypothetical protein [Streptomyces termitum]GHA92079.1 membrane protein [Streptomyces termitum]